MQTLKILSGGHWEQVLGGGVGAGGRCGRAGASRLVSLGSWRRDELNSTVCGPFRSAAVVLAIPLWLHPCSRSEFGDALLHDPRRHRHQYPEKSAPRDKRERERERESVGVGVGVGNVLL